MKNISVNQSQEPSSGTVTNSAEAVAQSGSVAEGRFSQMDWQQVVLNGGPPCFSTELANGDRSRWYCGRAERWSGHRTLHEFVSLDDLLSAIKESVHKAVREISIYEEDESESEGVVVYMRCLAAVGIDVAQEAEGIRQIMRDALTLASTPEPLTSEASNDRIATPPRSGV